MQLGWLNLSQSARVRLSCVFATLQITMEAADLRCCVSQFVQIIRLPEAVDDVRSRPLRRPKLMIYMYLGCPVFSIALNITGDERTR